MAPLSRRLPRELAHNAGKYVGIFLLMFVAIALTSGFLLAASSIERMADTMREDYQIEDGRFTTAWRASDDELWAAADAADEAGAGGADIYENFSIDADLEAGDAEDATVRAYRHREGFDEAAYAEGDAPEGDDEIALDRLFCEHHGIEVGDEVEVAGLTYTVSGIMTLPDYQALFEDNDDFIFNALTFSVAEVSLGGLERLQDEGLVPAYTYSFLFGERDLTDAERVDAEADMLAALADEGVTVRDLVDSSSNQGIGYVTDDVVNDSIMWRVLVGIIIVIMAFAFVVVTGSTIEQESAVIGTLLASGYRRGELLRHYLALPSLIGVLGVGLGLAVGCLFVTTPMKDLYYNSYSLPPFELHLDLGVFVYTGLVPLVLLVGITWAGLALKLRHTPLQFLRHETGRSGTRRGIALPERLGFPARFRLRVFLRNIGSFATLFCGIFFASLLLLFGLTIMPTMNHYADGLAETVPAEHLYTLKTPVELEGTDEERQAWAAAWELSSVEDVSELGLSDAELVELVGKAGEVDADAHPVNSWAADDDVLEQAEKYAVYQLQYDRGGDFGYESITVYGVDEDSRYWDDLDVGRGAVVFGRGVVEKFGLAEGDELELWDKYEDETYVLDYDGETYGTANDMSVYLALDDFNELFDKDADYFCGYASDEELQIDAQYLASDLTPSDMDKIGAQMTDSMGDMVYMLLVVAVLIFVVFMYLLTKTIIDRSARAISYMKVFGYRDREISRLYVRSITWTVVASLLLTLPIIYLGLWAIFKAMMMRYTGNISIYVPPGAYLECVAAGLASYVLIAFVQVRRIRRVPMEEALKVQE